MSKSFKVSRFVISAVIYLVVALFFSTGNVVAADQFPKMTIKLGTFAKPDDYVGSGIVYFMDLVKEKTKGAVKFDFHHSNVLGPEQGAFEMLEANTIQMFVFGFVTNKKFLGFYAPFLIRNFDHIDRVFKSDVGQSWREEVLKNNGVHMIGVLPPSAPAAHNDQHSGAQHRRH